MADPQRLTNDPAASPLGRALLASAAGDGPSSDNHTSVAKRLGIAAVVLPAATEAGAGAVVGTAMWWKIGLFGIALGGMVAVVVSTYSTESAESPPIIIAPAPRIAAPATLPPPPAPSAPVIASVTVDEKSEASPKPPARTGAKPPERVADVQPSTPVPVEAPPLETPPPPPAPSIDTRRLAAEVAVLDRARGALRKGDTTAALTALDEHRREFSDGALVAEAEFVRIETLIQRGEAATARDHARAFLTRFPQSPLGRRVRSLIDRLPKSAMESQ